MRQAGKLYCLVDCMKHIQCEQPGFEAAGLAVCPLLPLKLKTSFLQALLLALHLWSRCNSELLAKCPLLPSGAQPPVKGFFTSTTAEAADHPVAAAEAFFAASHLQKILMPLRLSSASHPRLHSLWPTLFALLVPGFTAAKVSKAVQE